LFVIRTEENPYLQVGWMGGRVRTQQGVWGSKSKGGLWREGTKGRREKISPRKNAEGVRVRP